MHNYVVNQDLDELCATSADVAARLDDRSFPR
jgi:hypothetical protein